MDILIILMSDVVEEHLKQIRKGWKWKDGPGKCKQYKSRGGNITYVGVEFKVNALDRIK